MEEIDRLPAIAAEFARYFATWEIRLPEEDLAARRGGSIRGAHGWRIQYLFGAHEQGEYLDFYALHRMTNPRHVRIYADGQTCNLPTIHEFMVFPSNATQAEKERVEREYFAHNHAITLLLREKGFRA